MPLPSTQYGFSLKSAPVIIFVKPGSSVVSGSPVLGKETIGKEPKGAVLPERTHRVDMCQTLSEILTPQMIENQPQ